MSSTRPSTFASAPLIQLSQTAAEWVLNGTFEPLLNQVCYETDTRKGKTGDGVTSYADLAYDTYDGSPFTGDAIEDLTSGTPGASGLIPWVEIVAGVAATGAGMATDAGTVADEATGTFAFGANPSSGDVLPAINGAKQSIIFTTNNLVPIVFPYIQIGANLASTMANLAHALQANKTFAGWELLRDLNFDYDATHLIITAAYFGTGGNAVTLGASTANITRSGATLSGGVDVAFITVNGVVFQVVNNIVTPTPFTIPAGTTATEYAENIAGYITDQTTLTGCIASNIAGALTITANSAGAAGNAIAMSTTDPNLTLDATLSGGVTAANILKQTTQAALQAGLFDYRGTYNASVNTFPATGGSGAAGAILKGDLWIISVSGTLGGTPVVPGAWIVAKVDTPGQTAGNWDILTEGVGGTVTSVSVVTANGFSGTVANPTTTPAITINASALDTAKIADGSVSNAEFQRLDGVTSAIQTQIDSKVTSGGALGTPSSGVATNLTGTAAGLTAGNATVAATATALATPRAIGGVNFDGSAAVNPNLILSAAHAVDDTYTGTIIPGLVNLGGVTQWDAVYLNASSQWVKADANGSGTYPARGLAITTQLTTVAVTVLTQGTVRNDAWSWTPGGTIYLSGTAGGLTQTAPSASGDNVQQVGFALTADIAFFDFCSTFITLA